MNEETINDNILFANYISGIKTIPLNTLILIINDIPYPEIKWNQTDVGYQVITKDWKDYIFIWEFVNWKKEWHCIRYSDWWMFEWEFKNDEPINNYR